MDLRNHVFDSIRNKVIIHRENARHDLDFGKGFYATSNFQQATERATLLQERERYLNGALADGKFVVNLCRKYFNREIDANQLIHGYVDDDKTKIQGIAPYSENYDQLSFHEDERLVNSVLQLHGFKMIAQNKRIQKR